jgi:anthranilate phosphoribosyltransferase
VNPFGILPDPQHLFDHNEAAQAFADILDARASEDEIEAFLIAWPCSVAMLSG